MTGRLKKSISSGTSIKKTHGLKSKSKHLAAELLISTARELISDDDADRLMAMGWATSDACKFTCEKLGITHDDYMDALKYIHKSGIVRGHLIIRALATRLKK
jgi:hypothetical protein